MITGRCSRKRFYYPAVVLRSLAVNLTQFIRLLIDKQSNKLFIRNTYLELDGLMAHCDLQWSSMKTHVYHPNRVYGSHTMA